MLIGVVESLWRYPVKSMGGEELTEAFMGFTGFYGDRCYAIKNSGGRKGFPYLNATTQSAMLRYRPRFRYPERALRPPNWFEAEKISPGVTYANSEPEDLIVDVITPSGEIVAIDDPGLLEMLGDGLRGENHLTIARSDRALTDCRPVSLISLQTIDQIRAELNLGLDKRRFRANIYFDLANGEGFAEDKLVGRRLRIGERAEVLALEKDPRCKMISLDPDSGEHDPQIFRHVAQNHDANAGVYCAVLVEGIINKDDTIALLE